ncbi:MAG: TonB-dependent receptor, partial [Planctomycetes bacterium]|nr:TonB-dependent receptor [Planctomycetota bacterium]
AVDYIRGGHAVRYSPNTVGGVLNFITRPVPLDPMAEVRTTVGDHGFLSTLFAVGGTRGDLGALATHVERQGDGYRRMGAFDQQDSNLKIRWDIAEDAWLAASVSHMESGHQAPGGLTRAEFAADRFANSRPGNRFDGSRTVLDLVYHRDLEEECWYEGYTALSETNRHLHAQRPRDGAATEFLDWTDESRFFQVGGRGGTTAEFLGMRHTLYGGVRFHREWIPSWQILATPVAPGPPETRQDSAHESNALSLHIDDTFHPVERVTVVLGFRIEWVPKAEGHDDLVGWKWEEEFFRILPGAGASYEITNEVTAFANYFEGFRSPQAWGFGSTDAARGLRFELGRSAELGLRYRGRGASRSRSPDGARSTTTSASSTPAPTRIWGASSPSAPTSRRRGSSGRAGRRWKDSASRLRSPSSRVSCAAARTRETRRPTPGRRKAAWRLRYDHGGWSATLGRSFVGDSFSDEANTRAASADGQLGVNPSRVLWDARLAKLFALGERARLECAVGATNLFDHDWYVHSRGGFFGGGLVAGPRSRVTPAST